MTDGVYCWPEGLAHYVKEHDVRLPDEFVTHVARAPKPLNGAPPPSFDHLGQRDREWPGPEFSSLLWQREVAELSDGHPVVEVEARWWLGQTGFSAV
jgi:hypothetical protein